MPVLSTPLQDTKFTLDASGIAGFFGGEEAISAMAAVHLFKGRNWLGWYNSPGSHAIAKRYGQIANARLWDELLPGMNETPAVSFGLDGRQGPKYIASTSETEMQTGHLGYLTMRRAKEAKDLKQIPGRETAPSTVTYLELKDVKYEGNVPKRPIEDALLAFIPISISFVACIMCALVADWYCFTTIILGIIINGTACLAIGSAELCIDAVEQSMPDAPSGNGMLIEDGIVVVMKGAEKDINMLTKGRFVLKIGGKPAHDRLAWCSLLLLIHVFLQLLLLPQCSLLGRVMFIGSLGVSWVYNSYLSSLLENAQARVLFKKLGKPSMRRFRLGTKTTMAVFVCLLVCDGMEAPYGDINPKNILQGFIPNDKEVWRRWRDKVTRQMNEIRSSSESLIWLEVDEDDRTHLGERDIDLLTDILTDAKSAFAGYYKSFVSC